MQIVKQFSFDAAHQLVGHCGKCANLHGHTYKLEVAVEGPLITSGSSEGMVIDFSDLKTVAGELVDKLDHATLIKGDEPIFKTLDTKAVIFGFRTTAEYMATFIYWYLKRELKGIEISFVRLWETPTGYAEFSRRDFYGMDAAAFGNMNKLFKKVKFINIIHKSQRSL